MIRDGLIAPVKKLQLLLLPILLLLLYVVLGREKDCSQTDFVEYWSAFKLFIHGLNPYDSKEIYTVEHVAGWGGDIPLPFYNPPWLLILLSPILILPFKLSYWLFVFLGLVGFVFSVSSVSKVSDNSPKLVTWIICLCFIPAWQALLLGQLGLLLSAGFAFLLIGLKEKKALCYGFGFLILSLKFHLFLPLLTGTLLFCLLEKWWLACAMPLLLIFVLCILGTVMNLSLVSNWVELTFGFGKQGQSGVDFQVWSPSTLLTGFRSSGIVPSLFTYTQGMLFLVVFPCAVAVIEVWNKIKQGRNNPIELACSLLLLSICYAPHAWIFDLTILVVPLALLSSRYFSTDSVLRNPINLILLCIPNLYLAMKMLFSKIILMHDLFWFPAITSFFFFLVLKSFNPGISYKTKTSLIE